MPETDRIDAAILSAISPDNNWTKVAMVIARALITLEGKLPEDHAAYDHVAQRVEALAKIGTLHSQGNVENWRHSEVKIAAK